MCRVPTSIHGELWEWNRGSCILKLCRFSVSALQKPDSATSCCAALFVWNCCLVMAPLQPLQHVHGTGHESTRGKVKVPHCCQQKGGRLSTQNGSRFMSHLLWRMYELCSSETTAAGIRRRYFITRV